MVDLKIKILVQILKNQRHILSELSSMHSSGKINSGIYSRDEISEELQDETWNILEEIEKWLKTK